MIECSGDLWEYPAEYRCVTTNGVVTRKGLVMGAGIALEAKRRFPGLPKKLGEWVLKYGNRPFICKQERIITFPTKSHWSNSSCIDLIQCSASLVVQIVDKYRINSVVMPRPGCGLGGLRWEDVKLVLESILDDRFTVVTNADLF